ncbi:metal ABC transporter permease [Bifidobacterium sp.]|uniref:metal ABC transporter permease n=1 Tax=Bifidobacterium sp. TaxID=41200 RepID=UPI0039ED004C
MFEAYLLNTWYASTVVAVSAGIIGVFVIMRGDSFLAHAIPHGSFAGAAVAVTIGLSPVTGMGIAALLSALAMHLLGKKGRRDAVIALLLVFLLAGGAFMLSMSGDYSNQVYALLFGQVLAVTDADLLTMSILALIAVAMVLCMIRPLLASSIMPEQARVQGVRNNLVALLFTIVIACVTTASVPIVGAMLLFSLLIAPPAAACALARNPIHAIVLSCVFALGCMWASVALSVLTDLPIGFFVATSSGCIYAIAKFVAHVWKH